MELFGANNEPNVEDDENEENNGLFPSVDDPADDTDPEDVDNDDEPEDYDDVTSEM